MRSLFEVGLVRTRKTLAVLGLVCFSEKLQPETSKIEGKAFHISQDSCCRHKSQDACRGCLCQLKKAKEQQTWQYLVFQAPCSGRLRFRRRADHYSRTGEPDCRIAEALQQYCDADLDAQCREVSCQTRIGCGGVALSCFYPADRGGQLDGNEPRSGE